ncbi:hypothetical protein Tco_1413097, partial [Tanacetum coccineum]
MGDEDLNTIPEKESDEFIKSSAEDLVPILSESEDTSKSDSVCDLPSCDNFSPINVYEEKSVTFSNPLFDSNDDFTSNIENGYHDSERDIIYLESLLIDDTILNLPPEELLDHNPRSLKDELDNDNLKSMVKVFDPRIWEKFFSPTYVRLSFEDRHYLSLTYVIRIFLPYLTYSMDSSLPLSSRSEDTIFEP